MSQSLVKNSSSRLILVVTLIAVLLVVSGLTWKWWPELSSALAPKYETPVLSADYLPADTGAVLHVNMREMQDSKFVKKEFGPLLRQYREQYASEEMQKSLGFDVTRDVDWSQVTVTTGDPAYLLMMAGKFDPAKFKTTPNGLHQLKEPPGDRYRIYELPYPAIKGNLTLTTGNDLLLMCNKPARVKDALESAAKGTQLELDDALLAEILTKVDRKQSIWGAANLKKLKPSDLTDASVTIKGLWTILNDAEAVYGGLTCGDDVQGTIHFLAGSDKQAAELETMLRDLCKTAKGDSLAAQLTLKLMNIPDDLKPLVKLIGTGKVSRDGKTVTLRCRLPEK